MKILKLLPLFTHEKAQLTVHSQLNSKGQRVKISNLLVDFKNHLLQVKEREAYTQELEGNKKQNF